MGERTGIEWADSTWNPWMGCHKVSTACKNCYAERDMQTRYGRDFGVVAKSKTLFDAPLQWAARWSRGIRDDKGVPPGSKIFACSWSDWFIEEADAWRDEAWGIIRGTPYIYLIPTKRPERILDHLPEDWGWGWENVWLGISAEDQPSLRNRLDDFTRIPAMTKFLSLEPLLGPVDIFAFIHDLRHEGLREGGRLWVITGGESDRTKPRPMDLAWVRDIRDQCLQAAVSYFHKQNGGTRKIDGAWGGRELDGKIWNQFPGQQHQPQGPNGTGGQEGT